MSDIENIKKYKNNGFILIKNFFNDNELTNIIKKIYKYDYEELGCDVYYENIFSEKKIKRVEKISKYIEDFRMLLSSKKLNSILHKFANEKCVIFKEKINFKSKGGGSGFGSHIDGHFFWQDSKKNQRKGWLEYAPSFINVVIPFCKTDLKNGCLRVSDMSYTKKIGNDWDEITNKLQKDGPFLTKKSESEINLIPIEMNIGDILFFDWKCIHGSEPNNSDVDRPILYLTYNKFSHGENMENYYYDKKESINTDDNKSLKNI